ncbi:MAG: lytic transglycosylase domain-containing protein [bacterium]
MAFNLAATSKYNYYFDQKFGEYKVMKPILHGRNTIFMLLLAVAVLFSSLYIIKTKVDEIREIHELKQFIGAFVEINNYEKIGESDVTTLAKEIYRAGNRFGMDPMLILAVITVESSFNKDAVSPMGARGLMQLLPATAKSISGEMGIEYNGQKTLSDVKTNITLGTYYLSKLSARYKNNMKLYLAAYNYGPEEVDRMLREEGGIPVGYAQRILKTYNKLSL